MKIRRFSGNPAQEFGKTRVLSQRFGAFPVACQFRIAEMHMKRAMADGMERNGHAPSPAFRHGVVPLDPLPQRTGAQPTGFRFSLAMHIRDVAQANRASPTRPNPWFS